MANKIYAIAKEHAGGFAGAAKLKGDLVMIDCLDGIMLYFGLVSTVGCVEIVKIEDCSLYYDRESFLNACGKIVNR